MRNVVLAGLILGAALGSQPASAEKNGPGWAFTGAMTTPRYGHTSTLLLDGRVLVAGGATANACYGPSIRSAELFDPATGTWSETGSLNEARSNHTAMLLQNGEVLVVGGADDTSAELYDPKTGTWHGTGSMNTLVTHISTTLIRTARILAVGATSDGVIGAELYDPETGTWSSVTPPNFDGNLARVVGNGDEGLAIAEGSPWGYGDSSAQVFDVVTEQWRPAGDLGLWWVESVTLLGDGNVLVTGLYGANFTTRAELFNLNPYGGAWRPVGSLNTFRHQGGYTATLLGNGQVLVAGGADYNSQQLVAAEELYSPGSRTWAFTGRLLQSRQNHTATLLPDGRVLVAGGIEGVSCDDAVLATAELYDPRITSTDPPFGIWIERNPSGNVHDVNEVAIDASNPKLMYAAAVQGVFKTTDGGDTWAQTSDVVQATAVAMDPHNPSTVFASSYTAARKTIDGGASWTEVHPNPARLSGAKAIAIDPSNSSTVYAVLVGDYSRDDHYTGLAKSIDGGSTFSYINSGLPFSPFYYGFDASAIAIAPSAPSTLFAYSAALARSTNGGASWSPVDTDFPFYVAALAVDPSRSSFVYGATQQRGLIRSSDGGNAWEELVDGLPTAWLSDVIVDPANTSTIYVSTYNMGVFKSVDRGQHFTTFSEGLPSSLIISALAIDATGTFLAAATDRGVFTISSDEAAPPPRRRVTRP